MVYSIIDVPIAASAGRDTGGEHALITLAEQTGGKYFYASAGGLDKAFAQVSEDLRTQYLLGYYPASQSHRRELFIAFMSRCRAPAADSFRYSLSQRLLTGTRKTPATDACHFGATFAARSGRPTTINMMNPPALCIFGVRERLRLAIPARKHSICARSATATSVFLSSCATAKPFEGWIEYFDDSHDPHHPRRPPEFVHLQAPDSLHHRAQSRRRQQSRAPHAQERPVSDSILPMAPVPDSPIPDSPDTSVPTRDSAQFTWADAAAEIARTAGDKAAGILLPKAWPPNTRAMSIIVTDRRPHR